jgi:hypothetical protein
MSVPPDPPAEEEIQEGPDEREGRDGPDQWEHRGVEVVKRFI